ncbi:unnamed protein product [Didymodactylos carnosus]|uniref:Uncharacterized protein n=1 Tax=Didymodactylos carnosus TaxID=1234261 RepID=A0A814E2D9_9BILA|nr:unnamed protein product [Didymodactylos carnosus]CAF1007581.1 unnamed protein product [Didymodactylos carnosus]CAF3738799.1 unnamed protein product [Didymodactylos carnosus]CAF3776586.1 unnamed protein product [Didymodactylos carnosus]
MLSSLPLLLIILFLFNIDFLSATCKANVWHYYPCSYTISSSNSCMNSMFTTVLESNDCLEQDYFWSYPIGNITMTIKLNKSFIVNLKNPLRFMKNVYRVDDDGMDTSMTTSDPIIYLKSDNNYRVRIKFQGPDRIYYYGTFIHYSLKFD